MKRIFDVLTLIHGRTGSITLTVCVGLLAVSSAAAAQSATASETELGETEPGEVSARQHFERGQTFYDRGEFLDAAQEFEASYAADPRASLLYNSYLAYRDLQDTANAARTLRQYLVEGTDLDATRRGQLRRRLEALERAVASDAAIPTSVEADAPPIEPVDDAPSLEPSPSTGGGLSPVGFIVAGAGLALGIGAVVTGVLSSNDYDQLTEQCGNGSCPDTPDLRSAQSRGAALATTTDVLWVTGTVALVAGVVLIYALRSEAPPGTTRVGGACTTSGCVGTLQGSF